MATNVRIPMRVISIIALLAAATATFAQEVAAQPANQKAALDAAFALVKDAVAKGDVPGAVALVAHRGRIVREEAYGLADVEQKIPFTPRTLCWIASITKPVTVAAAMKLVEAGKLRLDDTVESHLPEFKELKDKEGRHQSVTIRQLMCHTSGIQSSPPTRPDFFFEQGWLARKISDIAPLIAQTPLLFEPGSRVQYSNAAPYVLARVIEVKSGQPFHEFVRQAVLGPAGMADTHFIIPPSEAQRVAVVYRDTRDKRVEFFRFDPAWSVTMTLPDGGLFSSPREVQKFLQVFLDNSGKVLSRDSVKAMSTEQAAGWGLGWGLEKDGLFHHSGSSGTSAWADPATGVSGVLFFQLQNNEKIAPLQASFRKAVRAAFATPW
jgi:CubicO group peptidase (beta-lactamase class C family)